MTAKTDVMSSRTNVFPKQEIRINCLPSTTDKWVAEYENACELFNVRRVFVVHHQYIFDPYEVFRGKSSEEDRSGTLAGLLDSNAEGYHCQSRPYYTKQCTDHQKFHCRYQTFLEVLSIFDDMNDYAGSVANSGGYVEWFRMHAKPFLHKLGEKLGSELVEKGSTYVRLMDKLLDMFWQAQPKSPMDKGYYETVFLEFLQCAVDTKCTPLSVHRRPQSYTLDYREPGLGRRDHFHVKIVPDLEIFLKGFLDHAAVLGQKPVMFVKVQQPLSELTAVMTGTVTCETSDGVNTSRHESYDKMDSVGIHNMENCDQQDIRVPDSCEESPEMFQDIAESSIKYRKVKHTEMTAIGGILAQFMGDTLALFEYGDDLVPGITAKPCYKNKTMRYGIIVTGFKVMMVAVCFVDKKKQLRKPPALEDVILARSKRLHLHTNVFITRQFHLLQSKDRKCIAEMLFAIVKAQM